MVAAERVPREGPLVFAANHINGLVDPALLLLALPRVPRFLAKSTLWHAVILRPFLRLAAAIPVYRRGDPGVDPAANEKTFAHCHAVLAAGGAIAIFPEGRSHNEPALVPLHTGVSRIVLEAEATRGPLGTRIVPVGLTFEDKGRFRSRVLVNVGDPIDPAAQCARYREDPREAVRELTERVREALRAVTLNYPSWREARLIERAAEIYQRPRSELPGETALADRFPIRKAFIDGYETLSARVPERVAAVAEAVESYDALLAYHGLHDRQVAASYPLPGVGRFVAKSLVVMLVRLPLAVAGTVLNGPAFWAVHAVASRLGTTPDVLATYKLFGSLLFYPGLWLASAAVAWQALGPAPAVVVLAIAAPSGVVALRFFERRRFFFGEARAYFRLHATHRAAAALEARRNAVLDAVRQLAAQVAGAEPANGR